MWNDNQIGEETFNRVLDENYGKDDAILLLKNTTAVNVATLSAGLYYLLWYLSGKMFSLKQGNTEQKRKGVPRRYSQIK